MRVSPEFLKSIAVPASVGVVLYFLNVNFITWMFNVFPETVALVFGRGTWWLDAPVLLKVFYVGLVSPVVEELVFRRAVLGYFVQKDKQAFGLAVSTVVFALYHMLFGWGYLKAVIMLVPGLVFGVMFIRYGFRGCLSCHLSNNIMSATALINI